MFENFYKIAKYGDLFRNKYISQGYPENTVDSYIRQFNVIRQQKPKELYNDIPNVTVPKANRNDISHYNDFKQLETVIDYIKGQRQVKPQIVTNEKSSVTPVYENEAVAIYMGNNPQECINIKGSFPATWCVSASGVNNMYNAYRYKSNEPTFYFVKNKTDTNSKYNFFVIQVTKNNQHIVTSSMNDGDRSMTWDEILNLSPSLKGLQSIFKNIPLTEKEKSMYNSFSHGRITNDTFKNLPHEDKKLFLDVIGYDSLSNDQFRILPEDLKNYYIGFGTGLTDKMFDDIKDNKALVNRYKEITNRKLDAYLQGNGVNEFNKSEKSMFDETMHDKMQGKLKDKVDTYVAKIENKSKEKNSVELTVSEFGFLNKENREKLLQNIKTEDLSKLLENISYYSYDEAQGFKDIKYITEYIAKYQKNNLSTEVAELLISTMIAYQEANTHTSTMEAIIVALKENLTANIVDMIFRHQAKSDVPYLLNVVLENWGAKTRFDTLYNIAKNAGTEFFESFIRKSFSYNLKAKDFDEMFDLTNNPTKLINDIFISNVHIPCNIELIKTLLSELSQHNDNLDSIIIKLLSRLSGLGNGSSPTQDEQIIQQLLEYSTNRMDVAKEILKYVEISNKIGQIMIGAFYKPLEISKMLLNMYSGSGSQLSTFAKFVLYSNDFSIDIIKAILSRMNNDIPQDLVFQICYNSDTSNLQNIKSLLGNNMKKLSPEEINNIKSKYRDVDLATIFK